MSMTAEEILVNCEKQFNFIKKDIDFLIKYINQLIDECKQIDSSGYFKKQIEQILEELTKEQMDLAKNTYEREVSSNTHVAIETYNEIQRYAERKREVIADFKAKVFCFKKDVLEKEQENLLKALDKNVFEDIENLKNSLIAKYSNSEDKLYIKRLFEQNQHTLINKKDNELYDFVLQNLKKYKASNSSIVKEVVSSSIDLYKDDQDIVNSIKQDAKEFMSLINLINLQGNIKDYFLKSSKTAEQEAVRKDNVIKIVKAIREVGYIVNEDNIRKLAEKNLVLIHGEKLSGETADFAVRLDGSFVYNWEGFEDHKHDVDAQNFLNKLKEFNLHSSDEFKKQYREPKYIAKNKKIIKDKNTNSNSSK
ncbi:hypothetical protein [Spiroplasma floricola]|uniref:Uncharacterized protein n=1 Tax=Spiroplasma floricola 23-6 TaxID=1336749 RepID=A0A2K8SCM8_9MOLU|nr:hypothetical protein [Spiroplasma floricola]AUB31202.1 hypothetical protein SFLOR_v1c01410 [Spiroplasma floricola 23-6]